MIYTITQTNDCEYYRDVQLDMTLTVWGGDIIRHTLTLEKETTAVFEQWYRSPAEHSDFDEVDTKDVPRWCRCMADKMRPQIVAKYFQAEIDEWQKRQAETEETR